MTSDQVPQTCVDYFCFESVHLNVFLFSKEEVTREVPASICKNVVTPAHAHQHDSLPSVYSGSHNRKEISFLSLVPAAL